MSQIRSRNTAPEMWVRSLLHRLGYRFRIHRKDLPGRPDVVLPRHRKVVMVHGCFWHGHCCSIASLPKSNTGYWHEKIERNRARDRRNVEALKCMGWSVLELWECDVRKSVELERRLRSFMKSSST
jgi:DNA mismatch endonuclease, patch repair protein